MLGIIVSGRLVSIQVSVIFAVQLPTFNAPHLTSPHLTSLCRQLATSIFTSNRTCKCNVDELRFCQISNSKFEFSKVYERKVQTDFQQIGENQFLITVPDADNINHIVVFLTGTIPFPDGTGGAGTHYNVTIE
ncbi:hypothetical protein E2986_13990 [Frieseomelitta varia]|uniref:Hikeshi-like N-terminal domain-containing protein n=1 Tax=Frieseomelitta varia TaxID=561572 RepID=A0A833RS18_9HYME|nr:hypothetical protein E2986_13990 [Frieseomelitta varia]